MFLYTHIIGDFMATEVLVRFKGMPEDVLKKLVKQGIFSTKSEAVRAGIMGLGKEYRIVKSAGYYQEKLQKELTKASATDVKKALAELEA